MPARLAGSFAIAVLAAVTLHGCGGGGERAAKVKVAEDFFNCCEQGKGWSGCKQYVTDENATFSIQAVDALPGPPVSLVKSVKDYTDWMAGVVKELGKNANYTIKAHDFDKSTNTAMYYAVFGGFSDYVYMIQVDPDKMKVNGMTKVWNDLYAKNHMPVVMSQSGHKLEKPSEEPHDALAASKEFFDCCEKAKGWSGCKQYVKDENSTFSVQAVDALPGPPVSTVKSVKGYLDWKVATWSPKATHTIKASGYDKDANVAMFYAVFAGFSDYVYMIQIDPSTKLVTGMTKVWNDEYAKEHSPPQAAVVV